MSVLIKGMKKPFECLQCPFWTMYITPRKPIDVCLASDKKPIDCADLRPEWCPIVYMPENHGRLIDADALLESIKEARKKDPEIEDVYIDDYFTVAEWVVSAPAIIEGEEGE